MHGAWSWYPDTSFLFRNQEMLCSYVRLAVFQACEMQVFRRVGT